MKRLLAFFSPPIFAENEAKTRSAKYLNTITLSSLGLILLLTLISFTLKEDFSQVTRLIFLGIVIIIVPGWYCSDNFWTSRNFGCNYSFTQFFSF